MKLDKQQAFQLTKMIVVSFATVMIGVVAVLLAGLFDPLVDNDKILAIIGPAFMTIIGSFGGFLGGLWVGGGGK